MSPVEAVVGVRAQRRAEDRRQADDDHKTGGAEGYPVRLQAVAGITPEPAPCPRRRQGQVIHGAREDPASRRSDRRPD